MIKRLLVLWLAMLLMLAGCSVEGEAPAEPFGQEAAPSPSVPAALEGSVPITAGREVPLSEDGFFYSNLAGEASQKQVRQVLEQAGIETDALDKFFSWVEDFCQTMDACPAYTLQDAFVESKAPVVDYGDYANMSVCWYKTNGRKYSDILCRIAAFQLIKGFFIADAAIPQDQWQTGEDQWLCSDYDAISNFPIVDFSHQETAAYFTLYNPIPLAEDSSPEEMALAVKNAWAKRKLAFTQGPVSLLTIWVQSGSQTAAAHAAVLVSAGDRVWLVEKTNPQSPYQASVFPSRERAAEYLYQSIYQDNLKYNLPTGACVVFQNDQLLAQYEPASLS